MKLIGNSFLGKIADILTEDQEEFLEQNCSWKNCKLLSTMYLCEAVFSLAVVIKTKADNKLVLSRY